MNPISIYKHPIGYVLNLVKPSILKIIVKKMKIIVKKFAS